MQKFNDILPEQQNTAIALGFFDGIHVGHRRVLEQAVWQRDKGYLPICFTFLQSPKSVISKSSVSALMTEADKLKELEKIGIEKVIEADFNSIRDMSARDFFSNILVGTLKAKKLYCGFNYRFGKNGEGDAELLRSLCDEAFVEFEALPAVKLNEQVVSSTLIRQLIGEGRIITANIMLGSRFGFSSVVEYGRQLGRTIGTPTINQPLCSELVVPKFGVYVSEVTLESGKKYCGVTNIGIKPTVGGTVPLCETWMPEYRGDEIYGQNVDVRLIEFIRPEKKFDSLEELKEAIEQNGITAMQIYSNIL